MGEELERYNDCHEHWFNNRLISSLYFVNIFRTKAELDFAGIIISFPTICVQAVRAAHVYRRQPITKDEGGKVQSKDVQFEESRIGSASAFNTQTPMI